MKFEYNKALNKLHWNLGYLFSYFLFTTILFYILTFLNKLPNSWNYTHIMGITLTIVLIGTALKRLLR